MTIILSNKKETNKLKQQLEECLYFLYHLEDITNYEQKDISNCINLLQNTIIKEANYEDKR